MKKSLFFAAAAFLAACSSEVTVEVTNATDAARHGETVEVAWSDLAPIGGLTPENVVVSDAAGQTPSQVIVRDGAPVALIFQADVEAGATARFTVAAGSREAYAPKAFGRYVPERLDDYAWENDKVAYRLYGPALETEPGQMLVTPGIDVWVKSTDRLVIDEWFAKGDYHHNYGDGMDCYKVGPTLGAGACAPYGEGRLWLSRNYATQETLDNGPIRTTVKLTYAPFEADGREVSLTKYISLDAGRHFNRMEQVYEGDFDSMPVAAGVVRHEVKGVQTGDGWMTMYEAASDTDDPVRDGDIYFGIILPGAEFLPEAAGHAVAVTEVEPGKPMVYWVGSGWSGAGIGSFDGDWQAIVSEETAMATQPLKVTVRK